MGIHRPRGGGGAEESRSAPPTFVEVPADQFLCGSRAAVLSAGAGSGAVDFSHPGASLSAAFAALGFLGQGAAAGFGAAGAVITVVVAGGASTMVVGGAGAAGWAALR